MKSGAISYNNHSSFTDAQIEIDATVPQSSLAYYSAFHVHPAGSFRLKSAPGDLITGCAGSFSSGDISSLNDFYLSHRSPAAYDMHGMIFTTDGRTIDKVLPFSAQQQRGECVP